MLDHTMTNQVDIESNDDQRPQNQRQQQQGWLDSAGRLHVVFGLLKLLIITFICEVIYSISLIEVTRPTSPNQVYWYLYIGFGTPGLKLLLWTDFFLFTWLVINLCLLMFALASSSLLARGSNWFLKLIHPFDNMPLSST